MPDLISSNYSQSDNANNKPAPNGFPVGILPSNVGGSIRAFMGAVKRFYDRMNCSTVSTGTASAYVVSYEVPPLAYTVGEIFRFRAHVANAAGATISIGGLAPVPLIHNFSLAALKVDEIKAGQFVTVVYDGSGFRFLEADPSGPRLDTLDTGLANVTTAVTGANGVIATKLDKTGGRLTGSLSSKVFAHGVKTSGTEAFAYADGNTHTVTVNGAVTFDPTGLAEGDVMQINILFQSGSIAVAGTTQWELGGGLKSGNIADLSISLTPNAAYRMVFETVAGIRTGVFQ